MSSMPVGKRGGFSLLEVVLGLGVFALLASGVFTGARFVFKAVYQSRIKIVEAEVANEHLEIIRNMPFDKIGILNGLPAGLLDRTTTTVRNNVTFTVTRTIRNIDDPFDGTIGGTPSDTAPTDYKFAQVEVTCTSCGQQVPYQISTIIAPKNLEGGTNTGALFIQVFDGSAKPVVGATVRVVATSTNPALDITDTTDSDGMLRLVGLTPATRAYAITVSKSGFTTEGTLYPSASVPLPNKPPATIVAQTVTQISFSIDAPSTLTLATLDSVCTPLANVAFTLSGTKTIGTDASTPPNPILLTNAVVSSGSTGVYTSTSLWWDNYSLSLSGKDVIGTIPGLPLILQPGVSQPVTLILGDNTSHSLVVHVRDGITLQPLSNATVNVTSTAGYDVSKDTGVGHISQTDWSGGSGQASVGLLTKYWTDDGHVDTSGLSGDVTLRKVLGFYESSGELESSIFDLGTEANVIALTWEPLSQPTDTGVDSLRFQVATSSSETAESWQYVGPDGTAATFFDSTHLAVSAGAINDSRYLRYKMYMTTASSTYTPTLSTLSVSYTTACTPPGQAYFESLSAKEYTVNVDKEGYQPKKEAVTVNGDTFATVDLLAQ